MKILVGINGDAESFLTAVMLREQGNDIMGGVINCAGANVSSAAASAEKAGITFVTIPGEGVTKAKIASVLCNYARDNGYDAVATGHYCRIVVDEEGQTEDSVITCVETAVCKELDQSYLLSGLSAEDVRMFICPVGTLYKDQVKEYAAAHGFYNATPVYREGSWTSTVYANSVRMGGITIQGYEGVDFDRGYSSDLCSSTLRIGDDGRTVKGHVYIHNVVDDELVADIIFFTMGIPVKIGESVAVYNSDGRLQIGGVIKEVLD